MILIYLIFGYQKLDASLVLLDPYCRRYPRRGDQPPNNSHQAAQPSDPESEDAESEEEEVKSDEEEKEEEASQSELTCHDFID